ncbi:TIGR04255 family protein [Microbulbifer sp. MCCC 1A16149]|uniref:TIGR04255 family protein n=1 Tax=Microbulbifer sp. MCCC 1A16149 TaxID=3411322 RepID=UPI003D113CFE
MTWQFENVSPKIYGRNPLASTHIELRFHPITRIGRQQADIAMFQDLVRKTFPKFKQNNVRGVSIDPLGNFSVQDEIEYEFSDVKGRNSITLNQQILRVNSSDHKDRHALIEQFSIGMNALTEVFGEVSAFRLGVRYVNNIDKERISSDLNQQLEWGSLVSGEFLSMPHEIDDLSNTNFLTEIRSNLANGDGEMTLRFGLTQNQQGASDCFRFDLDRYLHSEENIELTGIEKTIESFTQDIYCLFDKVMAEKLKLWMDS